MTRVSTNAGIVVAFLAAAFAAAPAAAQGPDWVARATGDGQLEYRLGDDARAFSPAEPQLASVGPEAGAQIPTPAPEEVVDASALAADPSVGVLAIVDISEQTMTVSLDGTTLYVWDVSTGLGAGWTPTGTFNPFWLSEHHRSSLYDDAPMPFSVFFNGNIAVHGTTQISQLGQPASRGCVRLHPDHAEIFFEMVEIRDYRDVTIRVVR